MAPRRQPPRRILTQDEQAVLKNLLVRSDRHIDGSRLFTCGGHTACAAEWQAIGVLSDLVLARKAPRTSPGAFELRLLSMGVRGLNSPQVQEILGAAWLVAARNAASGVVDLALNKQREMALAETLRPSGGGGEKSYAAIAGRLCDEGMMRVAGALGGIACATQRRGTGGRVWLVWATLVETLLSERTPEACTWKCLAPLCGRLLDVEDRALRPGGLPWRTPQGVPPTAWRERVARCVARTKPRPGEALSAKGWLDVVRMIVPVAGAGVRKMPNATDLALALDVLASSGAGLAPGLAVESDTRKVWPDIMALAANPAAGEAQASAARLVARWQQSRLVEGAPDGTRRGRLRRRA